MAANGNDRVHARFLDQASLDVWDFANPDEAANAALEVYGADAITAAAHCALNAHFDGRERDYRLWLAVFSKLGGGEPGTIA
ncbi:conserved hypothetical protein [Mesorhizobium plurifarium]|uniref:Uncharacterized protein n=1 Tax=Mesorhizobium plurifarium TaxID=69974 RepID=A0A090FR49_MESPL|nr:conserved hypothetical protein [Mesorhizobium plurifarium]